MNATKTGIAANIVGIIALALGMFGIDVSAEQQSALVGALGIVGLVINQALIVWAQRQEPKS